MEEAEIDTVLEGLILGEEVGKFEGLAASFPTFISIPQNSGALIVKTYRQITGSLTEE